MIRDIDEAVKLTQDRLAAEGGTMSELLRHSRKWFYPNLIGDSEWQDVISCTQQLPITMGALPFGFEIPLHTPQPAADFGVSLANGSHPASYFRELAQSDETNETARSVATLLDEMDSHESSLREIVGRKMMLEYDIGSRSKSKSAQPGIFLRPSERPIFGERGQVEDVLTVVDALVSAVGWKKIETEREAVERLYENQPSDTRIDSFGVFPARTRGIRLGMMGFKVEDEVCSFLSEVGWPGEISEVDALISRYKKRLDIIGIGANIDVYERGIGPTLGLMAITKERYTENPRYWLDDLNEWEPFLDTLKDEDVVVPSKVQGLADWIAKPSALFGKSGRYVLLRGIHHIKLVVANGRLQQVKAYVFMVISGAVSF